MAGEHPRLHHRQEGKTYVAGIDLAGEAEEMEDVMLQALTPRRDATVITICELQPPTNVIASEAWQSLPSLKVVEHYEWRGIKHTELYPQMVNILKNTWRCSRIVVDATGIGEPIASFLRKALGGKVHPFRFNQRSKSELGFGLLAAINGGRLKIYQRDGSDEARKFWHQMEKARSHFRPSQTMNFYVAPADGHDDYLMSLALAVEALRDYKPRRAKGW
jgi:hypothetical protein